MNKKQKERKPGDVWTETPGMEDYINMLSQAASSAQQASSGSGYFSSIMGGASSGAQLGAMTGNPYAAAAGGILGGVMGGIDQYSKENDPDAIFAKEHGKRMANETYKTARLANQSIEATNNRRTKIRNGLLFGRM
jgi:hypothetical protein